MIYPFVVENTTKGYVVLLSNKFYVYLWKIFTKYEFENIFLEILNKKTNDKKNNNSRLLLF